MIAILGLTGLVVLVLIAVFVVACAVVGLVIDDAVGAIGRGRRRAPEVSYWSIR